MNDSENIGKIFTDLWKILYLFLQVVFSVLPSQLDPCANAEGFFSLSQMVYFAYTEEKDEPNLLSPLTMESKIIKTIWKD